MPRLKRPVQQASLPRHSGAGWPNITEPRRFPRRNGETEMSRDQKVTDEEQRLIDAMLGRPRPRMIAIRTVVNPAEWEGYYAEPAKRERDEAQDAKP